MALGVVAYGKSVSKTNSMTAARKAVRSQRLDLKSCTPSDILALLAAYAASHGRTPMVIAGVHYTASVSSVTAMVAGLRQLFAGIGRDGGKGGRNGQAGYMENASAGISVGNPADSSQVRDFVAGYTAGHFNQGNDPVAAAVFSDAKWRRLNSYLQVEFCEAAEAGDLLGAFQHARDRTAFQFAYGGKERGGETGRLRRAAIEGLGRDDGLVTIRFERVVQGGPVLGGPGRGRGKKQARTKLTKAYKTAETAGPHSDSIVVSCGRALDRYLEFAGENGYLDLTKPDFFLFPQIKRGRKGVAADKPMTNDAVSQRLKVHLMAMGCYNGETAHSLKRSGLANSELSDEVLAKEASLVPKTVALYRDQTRPSRAIAAGDGLMIGS